MISCAVLSKYNNQHLVSVGVDCVQAACNCEFPAGMFFIIPNSQKAMSLSSKYSDDRNIHILSGDPVCLLEGLIKTIAKPITFVLDCYNQKYLSIIAKHPINRHVILIKGRCINNQDQIIKDLLRINEFYTILFEDSLDAKLDIMAAMFA